jgi:hypothetical protein
MLSKVKLEGTAEIDANILRCVCAFCNNIDEGRATIEFNFREQKIFYLCEKCKKMNEIYFGQPKSASLPKIRIGR